MTELSPTMRAAIITALLGVWWLTDQVVPSGAILSGLQSQRATPRQYTPRELWEFREESRDMFYHAYDNYMAYAHPWDELKPLSCEGRRWDRRERGTLDDSLGGFSLTRIDALDTLAVLGDYQEFEAVVLDIVHNVTFDRNVTVSLFETTIRIMGGLLSGHMLASNTELGIMPHYDGALLRKAIDLGYRLLPAFNTPTGIPLHRVNLRHGVLPTESPLTCTAAAGTLLLEFGLLSRLSQIPQFEMAARTAVTALWERRSRLNLVGVDIDTVSGQWQSSHSSIGAGADSFFEYMIKSFVLFHDTDMLDMFQIAHDAITEQLLFGGFHLEVSMDEGRESPRRSIVSALQAFWPTVEVLAHRLDTAVLTYNAMFQLWEKYDALPEAFDLASALPVHFAKDSPLRPELIESTFYLYLVTRDPRYISNGIKMMKSIQRHSRVPCGFAAVADVSTKRHDDRMDSYFLSETVKYLFLLFDTALLPDGHGQFFEAGIPHTQQVHSPRLPPEATEAQRHALRTLSDRGMYPAMPFNRSAVLFTTEGHLFLLNEALLQLRNTSSELPPVTGHAPMFPKWPQRAATGRPHKAKADQGMCPLDAAPPPAPRQPTPKRTPPAPPVPPPPQPSARSATATRHVDTKKLVRRQPVAVEVKLAGPGDSEVRTAIALMSCDDSACDMRLSPITVRASWRCLEGQECIKEDQWLAIPAAFGPSLQVALNARAGLTSPPSACRHLDLDSNLVGRIAISIRGGCPFSDKARHAQAAGAIALVIVDLETLELPWSTVLQDPSDTQVTPVNIPVVLVQGPGSSSQSDHAPSRVLLGRGRDLSVRMTLEPPPYIVSSELEELFDDPSSFDEWAAATAAARQ